MRKFLLLLILLLAASCLKRPTDNILSAYRIDKMDGLQARAYQQTHFFLKQCIEDGMPAKLHSATRIDTIIITDKILDIRFTKPFAQVPMREGNTRAIQRGLRQQLGNRFKKYQIRISAEGVALSQLIPNFYRTENTAIDSSRLPRQSPRPEPLVENLDRPFRPNQGLFGRNIALWPSHGWYFEPKRNRWEWQRARVFQTIEDLLPMAFTHHYLVPMLENAGAMIFQPRERDLQRHEVLIDDDSRDSAYVEISADDADGWRDGDGPGFGILRLPYDEFSRPFREGRYRQIPAVVAAVPTARVLWVPEIPESGYYAVHISYKSLPNSAADANYRLYHGGGITRFKVNQKIGGGTWIYLGRFYFEKGRNPEKGRLELGNHSRHPGTVISADAVRFGGGMGNVSRKGQLSGRPRYMEGARYYLQYAGMPDTLVYNVTMKPDNDYIDDYRSRGEWVNYLRGAPFGPNRNRLATGLGIPIDFSLSFHTDAGKTGNASTIGTLMITDIHGADSSGFFPDGVSRLANRDIGDIMQTQIVDDLRAKYDSTWNRRSLWNRRYSEAFRPNVPAVLLELLSHHNFADMRYALDPRFRFDASRAIYKGILKFLNNRNGLPYRVQPLPVSHFSVEFEGEKNLSLNWRPTEDPLEATARAEQYILYTRIENGGFDNGRLIADTTFLLADMHPGKIYDFKVSAVNAGGESFPSEVLSACRLPNGGPPLLIVNGFDRISGPARIDLDEFKGFADFWDHGVPDRYDLNYIGSQINFDPHSDWFSDEAPGHGASHSNMETAIIAGNSFDFTRIHGEAIRAAGYSFVSSSDEAVWDGLVALEKYPLVDLYFGEEKRTDPPGPSGKADFEVFPKPFQDKIGAYLASGGNLLLSGAYIGTDLFAGKDKSHPDIQFARNTLKMIWFTNHAARNGELVAVDSTLFGKSEAFQFQQSDRGNIYSVEAPDGIAPADSLGRTILRYRENNTDAGFVYDGKYRLAVLGFPFETVSNAMQRQELMAALLKFLNKSSR